MLHTDTHEKRISTSDIIDTNENNQQNLIRIEPINERLQRKEGFTGLVLQPRNYQRELYLNTLRENSIIYLGTGLGKTFITVLFLNSPYIDAKIQQGRKVVFLAPSRDLIQQQAEYFNKQLRYRIKIYCSASARCGQQIDVWQRSVWQEELKAVDALFMIPEIFNKAIEDGRLNFENFAAIIFDEAHHAGRKSIVTESNDPYAKILRLYERFNRTQPKDTPRPRLIGLTASLFNKMSTMDRVRGEIDYLEKLFHGKCITVLEVAEKRPTSIIHTFNHSNMNTNDPLIGIFKLFIDSLKESLKVNARRTRRGQGNFINLLQLAFMGIVIKPVDFPKILEDLSRLYEIVGCWMLRSVIQKLAKALERHSKVPSLTKATVTLYRDFICLLEKICTALARLLDQDINPPAVLSFTRPKPMALLDVLITEYRKTMDGSNGKSSFSCVIFVTCRLEVFALNDWLQTVSSTIAGYEFIKCDFAIGQAGATVNKYGCITKKKANEQHKMLSDFRMGILNTIVTTAVLEEGIDLPVCSTVIRYDSPQNFRQYVQSRGRARQDISSIVTICDTTSVEQEINKLKGFNEFELKLKSELADKDIRMSVSPMQPIEELSSALHKNFIIGKHKVIITPETARIIISKYCDRLARKNLFTDGLQFERITMEGNRFQTTLLPPTGCPVKRGVRGAIMSSSDLADDSAILAFFSVLDTAGELDELSPNACGDNIDQLLASKNLKPKYECLEKSLEGLSLDDDKENGMLLFEPELLKDCTSLSINCANRVYKLIKISFAADHQKTRISTKAFFEVPSLGMIIDSKTDFLPEVLYNQYGQFRVHSYVISDNLLIKEETIHKQYLSYTHKLLQECLGLKGVSKRGFENHCQFYLVLLDNENNFDLNKMAEQASKLHKGQLRKNDIVKYSHHYKGHERGDRLMLVRGTVVSDLNAKIGAQKVAEPNQQYVEVMPISCEFASTSSKFKKYEPGYDTASIYLLEKHLEPLDYAATTVFQSQLLPPIIAQLYITIIAVKFNRKFIEDTRTRRHNFVSEKISDPPLILQFNHQLFKTGDQARQVTKGPDFNFNDQSEVEPSPIVEDDKHNDSDVDQIVSDDDIDLEEDKPIVQSIWPEIFVDQNASAPMSKIIFEAPPKRRDSTINSRELIFEYSTSPIQLAFGWDPRTISCLSRELEILRTNLSEGIRNFSDAIEGNVIVFEEQMEFKKRSAKVDLSIVPPIHFDRDTKPLMASKNRERGLIEALTQRKAGETFNLETLENIGDCYLKYVVSVVIFKNFIEEDESTLSLARSRLVCNKYFTHLAKKNNLGSLAITNSFSEKNTLAYILGKQICTKEDMHRLYNKLKPKSLADTFESIIGAHLIYLSEFEAITVTRWLGLDIFQDSTSDEQHEKAVVFTPAPSSSLPAGTPEIEDTYRLFKQKVQKFEEIIGYKFNNPSHLIQAFTHPSSVLKCTPTYERLEFLGDALLDILVTTTLVHTISTNSPGTKLSPGRISSSRSALVNNSVLAKLSLTYSYDLFIQYNTSELFEELNNVRSAIEKDPSMDFLEMLDYDKIVKLLADVFESVAAAIYLDSSNSLDTLWSVYYPMLKKSIDLEAGDPTKDCSRVLHEAYPGPGRISFKTYDIPICGGNLIGVCCRVIFYDNNKPYCDFKGQGISKRQAKRRAIRLAVEDLPSIEIRQLLKVKFYAKLRNNDPK